MQGANQGQQAMARMFGPLLAAYLYSLAPPAPYLVGVGVVLAGMLVLKRSAGAQRNQPLRVM